MIHALKLAVLAVSTLFFATLSFAVTVTVSSPTSGATVSSPMTLYASATGSQTITGWYVYVDGNAAWHTAGPTSNIAAQLSMGGGSHSVHVRAWQSDGSYGDRTLSVNVGTSSSQTPPSTVTASGVQVTLQSPSSGASVSSSFTVNASASSPNGISGWAIYSDSGTLFIGNTYSNSLSKSVSLGSGTHYLWVTAWDKGGAGSATSAKTQVSVSGSTSSSSSGALPSIPSSAKTWWKLEETTDSWSSCGTCAGGNSTSNYWMANWQSSPSLDGASREFYNGGGSWANTLWIKKLGNQSWAHNFLWDFWVNFNSTTAANAWTAEYDLWQSVSGHEFMIGSQCNFGLGRWDVWSSSSGKWIGTSIPCPRFSANSWHHIQWYVQRVSSNQYKYVTLVVDGKAYSVNQTYYTNSVNWADSMGVQWQLDNGAAGYDSHEWIDQVKLSIW